MTTTDPIADMLARIRNAQLVRHTAVEMPSSKIKAQIANILKSEGYIKDFYEMDGKKVGKVLHLDLKYRDLRTGTIQGLKRVSTPGRRVYCGADEIPRVLGGLGIAIVSTSKGIMTDREARKNRAGGEVLCAIW